MELNRLRPEYIEGFVKQCRDKGLNETQTSGLLDEMIKKHLTENNEHYRGAAKEAFTKAAEMEKSAVPSLPKSIQAIRAPLLIAGGLPVVGSHLINRNNTLAGIADHGLDLNLGVGGSIGNKKFEGKSHHLTGNQIGGLVGTGLGLASMLRGRRIGHLKNLAPFARKTVTGPKGDTFKTLKFAPGKMISNPADALVTGLTAGAGGFGGWKAVDAHRGMSAWAEKMREGAIDRAKGLLDREGYFVGKGGPGGVPSTPWYAQGGEGAAGGGSGTDIPNLSLLPGEVQDAARSNSRDKTGLMGPNFVIDQAGKQINMLDQQLAQQRAVADDPARSPMARYKAQEAISRIELRRDDLLEQARFNAEKIRGDQDEYERSLIAARADAAARGETIDDQINNWEDEDSGQRWFGLRTTRRSPSEQADAFDDLLRRQAINKELLWKLNKSNAPNLFNPSVSNFVQQYGL